MFTQRDYEEFVASLKEFADEKYRRFNAISVPGAEPLLGVRIPCLRKAAKSLMKNDFEGYLALPVGRYFEERMVRAMVLAKAEMPLEKRLSHIRDFLPLVDNWFVCDVLCGDFKSAKDHREAVWDFVLPYFAWENEFSVRFAAVMLLWHFTTEEYTKKSLERIASARHPGYYAKMGEAWAVAQFFTDQRDLTLPYLESRAFEPWVQNKAIQKIRESLKTSPEDKAYLLNFKTPESRGM